MIKIQLLENKRHNLQMPHKYKIIAGENLTTQVEVIFPSEYKDFHKRVDFVNERGDKWTIALYTPEYEKYDTNFDTLNLKFDLPNNITLDGEIYLQFLAYKPYDHIMTPFDVVILLVEKGIMYAKKQATDNPDLLVKSYEHSVWAADQVRQNNVQIGDFEQATNDRLTQFESDTNDKIDDIKTVVEHSNDTSDKALATAKTALDSAETAEQNSHTASQKATQSAESARLAHKHSVASSKSATNAQKSSENAERAATTAQIEASLSKDREWTNRIIII